MRKPPQLGSNNKLSKHVLSPLHVVYIWTDMSLTGETETQVLKLHYNVVLLYILKKFARRERLYIRSDCVQVLVKVLNPINDDKE